MNRGAGNSQIVREIKKHTKRIRRGRRDDEEKVISSRYKNDELDRVNCIKLYCLQYRKKISFFSTSPQLFHGLVSSTFIKKIEQEKQQVESKVPHSIPLTLQCYKMMIMVVFFFLQELYKIHIGEQWICTLPIQ